MLRTRRLSYWAAVARSMVAGFFLMGSGYWGLTRLLEGSLRGFLEARLSGLSKRPWTAGYCWEALLSGWGPFWVICSVLF